MHGIGGLRRPHGQVTGATARRERSRGQSMVELALVMPVVLMVILGGIDFGRVFLGWVDLHSMARHAADYAAAEPGRLEHLGPRPRRPGRVPPPDAGGGAGDQLRHPHAAPDALVPERRQRERRAGRPGDRPGHLLVLPDHPDHREHHGQPGRGVRQRGIPDPIRDDHRHPDAHADVDPDRDPGRHGHADAHAHADPDARRPPPPARRRPRPGRRRRPTPDADRDHGAHARRRRPRRPCAWCPTSSARASSSPPTLWALKGHGNDDGANFTTTLVFSPLVGKNDSGRVISQSQVAGGNRPCASTAMTVTWSP